MLTGDQDDVGFADSVAYRSLLDSGIVLFGDVVGTHAGLLACLYLAPPTGEKVSGLHGLVRLEDLQRRFLQPSSGETIDQPKEHVPLRPTTEVPRPAAPLASGPLPCPEPRGISSGGTIRVPGT